MGNKSPAKILRSTKRITRFLSKKCNLPAQIVPKKASLHLTIFKAQTTSIPPKPIPRLTIQCVETTNVPPSNPLQTCSTCTKILPLPAKKCDPIGNELDSLLRQYKEESQKEREKYKIERQRDLEKFELEIKSELDKIMPKLLLPR